MTSRITEAMLSEPEETREWDEWAHPRCDYCGRFCDPVDGLTPWGPGMEEPPEDAALCPKCANDIFERCLADLIRLGVPKWDRRPWWHSPNAWYRARAIVRGKRKHGLLPFVVRHERVRKDFDTAHVLWCKCGKPERHPVHDREQATRMRLRWCRYESSGKQTHARSARTRQWCSCGWSTPWLDCGRKYEQDIRPQWNEHGGVSGGTFSDWLIEQHIAQAHGCEYPEPMRRVA